MQTLNFTCYSTSFLSSLLPVQESTPSPECGLCCEVCKNLDLLHCSSGGGELFVKVTWKNWTINSTPKTLFNRCASFYSSHTFTNWDLALCNHLKQKVCLINFISNIVNYTSSNECEILNLRKLKSFVKASESKSGSEQSGRAFG